MLVVLSALNLTFLFVSLSCCNHVLRSVLAINYYIIFGVWKNRINFFFLFFLTFWSHSCASLHLISHDHLAFLLSIHLLLQSVLACYAKDFCYFRFSLFARLKENHLRQRTCKSYYVHLFNLLVSINNTLSLSVAKFRKV